MAYNLPSVNAGAQPGNVGNLPPIPNYNPANGFNLNEYQPYLDKLFGGKIPQGSLPNGLPNLTGTPHTSATNPTPAPTALATPTFTPTANGIPPNLGLSPAALGYNPSAPNSGLPQGYQPTLKDYHDYLFVQAMNKINAANPGSWNEFATWAAPFRTAFQNAIIGGNENEARLIRDEARKYKVASNAKPAPPPPGISTVNPMPQVGV